MELAWQLQARVFGDLDRATRRQLAAFNPGERPVAKTQRGRLAPGTQIVREWRGKEYRIDVLTDGFGFDGKQYRSLSAIAHRIAGVRWSGPRFFGLDKAGVSEKARP
jgi:hypothetical protein